jgi:hypothetical protein
MKVKTVLGMVALVGVGAFGMFLIMSAVVVDADCTDDPCRNPPCCNGDVTGKGEIDIADAIYLLSYLFAGGPEPVQIECPVSRSGGLPDPGRMKWHVGGSPWSEIDCASEEYPGQDGFYQKGCPMEGRRFVDNEDGTVTDNCTGLTWQQATAAGTYTWAEALQYCENLGLGGETDWRLPNVRELQSIVDYGRYSPAIDPVFSAESWWYWSSSSGVNDTNHAWHDVAWRVSFSSGHVVRDDKSDARCVRAVRG